MSNAQMPSEIDPVERPRQFDRPLFPPLPEVDSFLWVSQARAAFNVSGAGQTVAVLATGLNTAHVDFAGRVVAQAICTPEQGASTMMSWPSTSRLLPERSTVCATDSSQLLSSAVTTRSGKPA